MIIQYPDVLWLLLGVVPLIGLFVLQYFRGVRQLAALGKEWERRPAKTIYFAKWFGQILLFCAFYVFMVLSLAEFQWGDEPVEEDRRNLDLVFLVDVSRSMLAQDAGGSRLDAAKEYILGLTQEFPGARFSLIAFKGEAIKLVPMTENTLALVNSLLYLTPSVTTSSGTSIEAGLRAASRAEPEGSDRHRIVILLSDGEALSGNLELAASEYLRLGISVLSVGFGTREGAAIPLEDQRLLRDPQSGEVVITRSDPSRLHRIAELTGGEYFEASDPGAFTALGNWLKNLVEVRATEGFRLVLIPRFQLFLGIALALLCGYVALRAVRIRGVV